MLQRHRLCLQIVQRLSFLLLLASIISHQLLLLLQSLSHHLAKLNGSSTTTILLMLTITLPSLYPLSSNAAPAHLHLISSSITSTRSRSLPLPRLLQQQECRFPLSDACPPSCRASTRTEEWNTITSCHFAPR